MGNRLDPEIDCPYEKTLGIVTTLIGNFMTSVTLGAFKEACYDGLPNSIRCDFFADGLCQDGEESRETPIQYHLGPGYSCFAWSLAFLTIVWVIHVLLPCPRMDIKSKYFSDEVRVTATEKTHLKDSTIHMQSYDNLEEL